MARQDKNKFAKRQKELERKKKADEKMARRHSKKNEEGPEDSDAPATDQP